MRPVWLIEANVDGLPSDVLVAEVRRQGMTAQVVKHLPMLPPPKDIAGSEAVPSDACVIFRGTLRLMRHIDLTRRWRPGAWCAFANLACSVYYAHFGPFLLNREYALLPCADALRLCDSLFRRYGRDGQVFVRPDAVDKTFTGALADKTAFQNTLAANAFDPTLPVLVAAPRRIDAEWRLIVAHGAVIAGSQYRLRGALGVAPGYPTEVLAFAAETLERVPWRPAALFVMDVCASEDGLRLVELNSFGCSGHYDADLATIVTTASASAASAW